MDPQWRSLFEHEFGQPYMQELYAYLKREAENGKTIFPPADLWFNAFLMTPMPAIKVVIVGQDPYHAPGQAHGLSFSVPRGVSLPPSLKNIYKELFDAGHGPLAGDLTPWAREGVLLLNASLTVEQGLPGSHAKKGWLTFTNRCLRAINEQCEQIVFLSWGKFAHGVCSEINTQRHRVIKTSHPSPLGASKSGADFDAFLGSGCFAQANQQLRDWGREPVNWHAVH
ncbi:uracil-DNA glycosylase [Simiduia aestuariiviva]|uniref:Uracil-DNA glycosylase n=1 Tax=Simiduia aestuariiviva TaxID=1510459 RepID=A0A839US93_9GAMM|nr:uracil-DNA glycosylase [Simiduia aestuariiviva]MBB3168255.1 uracil-DNA glycosylase [Simiduia aestuariiviva]